jgi:mannose-6-phosphate isomerase-like protein (cupin superfamily)
MISYARLDIGFDVEAVKREVIALGEPWSLHFNTMHYEGEWTVLSLRVPGGDSERIIPDMMGGEECMDTALMAKCPVVKALLNSMQCEILSVRFLNLKAGAYIKPHRDHELAFEHGEARLHFPIFTNAQVEFFVEDGQVRMNEGECWYINANLMHSVANKGSVDRIHLVVDCKVNDWLREVFEQGEKQVVPDMQREQLLQVIAELRSQQTEIGDKLAAELEQQL